MDNSFGTTTIETPAGEYTLEIHCERMSGHTVNRSIEPNPFNFDGRHPWRITYRNGKIRQPRLNDRVERWDVYDVADNLDSLPWLIQNNAHNPHGLRVIARYVQIMAGNLYRMAERGGSVGCSPDYQQTS